MADFKKGSKIITSALNKVSKDVRVIEPKFNQMLLDWVMKFSTSSGNLSKSKSNKKRMQAFRKAVDRFLLRSGYYEMVQDFIVNFDELQDNQQKFQKDFNDIKLTKSFLNPFKQLAIKDTLNNLTKQGLDINLVRPIEKELSLSVAQGSSLKDMILNIESQLVTNDERSGMLRRLVTQGARDALGQYDGTVNEAVRKSYKMDAFLYVGSHVKDTRAQCIRWTGKGKFGVKGLLAIEDLQDEINWAKNNGTGFIPSTTVETFAANRGGYNCRHDAYPTRLENYR